MIDGVDKIGRLFAGLSRKPGWSAPVWTQRCVIDGLPGMLSVERDGTWEATALEIAGGRISAIYVIRNPDKLRHLAPLIPEGAI